jgi:pimeloyl-ACP methyl ester carboxylesterase
LPNERRRRRHFVAQVASRAIRHRATPLVTFSRRRAGIRGLLMIMKLLIGSFAAALLLAASSLGADAPKLIDVKVTGHGKPVIFIPGLACSGAVWDDTVKHLQDKYECHVVSIAGFGGAPAVKTDDLIGNVRDQIIAYARDHKLAKPTIIGHSLGGSLALAIGEAAPDLPGDIVSVDGLPFLAGVMFPGVTDAAGAKKAAAAIGAMIARETPEQFANYQRGVSIPAMVTRPEDVARIADMCGKSDPATVAQAMSELLGRDFRPELGKIKCPILVLGALAGLLQYAPEAALEQNYKTQFTNAPQTRFQFFEKSKHFIMVDDPAGFYATLDKELAAH